MCFQIKIRKPGFLEAAQDGAVARRPSLVAPVVGSVLFAPGRGYDDDDDDDGDGDDDDDIDGDGDDDDNNDNDDDGDDDDVKDVLARGLRVFEPQPC